MHGQIRGAPAIASLAALSISSHLFKALKAKPPPPYLESTATLREHVQPLIDHLSTARPTAVNLGAAMRRLATLLERVYESQSDVREAAQLLIEEGRAVAHEDVSRNHDMSKWGAEWLVGRTEELGGDTEKLNVLTVCNTGSLATSVSNKHLGDSTHPID